MKVPEFLARASRSRKKLAGAAGLLLVALAVPTALSFTSGAGAATDPILGAAGPFGVLSSTYTNTAIGTTINGDLGYLTGPAVAPTVSGTTYVGGGTYAQAGIDQGSALASLNSQACTFTFPPGAVNLATDTSHGPLGIYTPGVYCTTATSAASIGTAGITLSGSGTFIFRIDGALTTVANSSVTFANGASACDLYWTPAAATTLGATSTFAGTDIDASGVTVGSTVTWTGRALAFGGTVSTTSDTITVPTCSSTSTTTTTTTPTTTTSSPTTTSPPTTTVPAPSKVQKAPKSPLAPASVPVTG